MSQSNQIQAVCWLPLARNLVLHLCNNPSGNRLTLNAMNHLHRVYLAISTHCQKCANLAPSQVTS